METPYGDSRLEKETLRVIDIVPLFCEQLYKVLPQITP